MKVLLFSMLLAVYLVSGCASRGPFGPFAGPLPEKGAVAAIADDAVSILADLFPPGHTAIRLLPAKDAENGFALAFESGLRAKGFTLAAPDASDALTLAYTLDMLEEKAAWYLQLRLPDPKGGGKVIARCYLASGLPEAGQSRAVLGSSSVLDTVKEKAGKAYEASRDFLTQ
jgi:hypothetical protein